MSSKVTAKAMKHYRELNVEIARRLGEVNTILRVPQP